MRHTKYRLSRWLTAALTVLLATVTVAAQADETITYIHWDALGSPVAATDEEGNVVWREAYRPYGERINNEAAAGPHSRWYTGHPQDADTGLVYAGARYYDPVVGRFLAIDPVDFQEDNLHSFNRYVYGSNNPYRYVDPDGKEALSVLGDVPANPAPGMGTWITAGIIAAPLGFAVVTAPTAIAVGADWALGEVGFGAGAAGVAAGGKLAANVGDFFEGTRYTDKVRRQMQQGDFHSFPDSVKAFQDAGTVGKLKGGDGIIREKLEIPGGYRGREGNFEFTKESDGSINHRLFKPNK